MSKTEQEIIRTQEQLIDNQKTIIEIQKKMLNLHEEKEQILKNQIKELEDYINAYIKQF